MAIIYIVVCARCSMRWHHDSQASCVFAETMCTHRRDQLAVNRNGARNYAVRTKWNFSSSRKMRNASSRVSSLFLTDESRQRYAFLKCTKHVFMRTCAFRHASPTHRHSVCGRVEHSQCFHSHFHSENFCRDTADEEEKVIVFRFSNESANTLFFNFLLSSMLYTALPNCVSVCVCALMPAAAE